MYRYVKYIYYKTLKRSPSLLSDRVYMVKRLNADPYKGSPMAQIATASISVAMAKLTHAVSVDYDAEYAIPDMLGVGTPAYRSVDNWYSSNGRYIDGPLFEEWLELVLRCDYNRTIGLRKSRTTRAYMNSIKLTPFIEEASSILEAILFEHGFL